MNDAKNIITIMAVILIIVAMIGITNIVRQETDKAEESVQNSLQQYKETHAETLQNQPPVVIEKTSVINKTELVISDNAVIILLITVCVIICGTAVGAGIYIWHKKREIEREYTKEMLEVPLEKFSSMEVNQLKKKYRI